ncbi:MAG: ATP-binding cassette domain-containing protein [Burkholderiales bacterium]|nr:ATP-binding cassette domain-containing protein [Burkholderiales bacterium]
MANPILSISELAMHFPTRAGLVRAVDGVSLDIEPGETVGLVGESGCGKSTLGKTAMRLTRPTAGSIRLEGKEIADLSRGALRPLRPKLQMIFQDPYASLNPRLTVGRALEEPLVVHGRGNAAERRERVRWLADKVGLRPEALQRHPHEFSGGQRQRIGIARALALEPKLVICDEPVSALDVSVRAQVINLLMDLKRDFGLAYLFISHDLSVVEHVSDRIAVMYLGKLVELADRRTLWTRPLHPYTQALMAAVPVADPSKAADRKPVRLEGDLPSPLDPPNGCRFRTRCPIAVAQCAEREPALQPLAPGHFVACDRVAGA